MSLPPPGFAASLCVLLRPDGLGMSSQNPGRRSPGPLTLPKRAGADNRAFSLIELLVVMGIVILVLGLGVPALSGLKGSRDVTAAAYDIAGTLEGARAYAMANRTYVWVGFIEEDGSKASAARATAGVGRVVLCVVASKDGSRYRDATTNITSKKPAPFGDGDPGNQVALIQLNKVMKLNNTHLVAANVGRGVSALNIPDRPAVDADYQVGDPQTQNPANPEPFSSHYADSPPTLVRNPTVFYYPLGSTKDSSQYAFVKIIEFNPQGDASKIVDNVSAGIPAWLEIAVVPTRGSLIDPRYRGNTNAAAMVQVGGLNGRVRIFRP